MRRVLGGTTPICITYHRVPTRPCVKRTRKFVGLRRLFENVVGMIADTVHSLAYEEEEKLELPDGTVSVHWALEVDDPWGFDSQSSIVAVRVPESPPAGTHFEVFRVEAPDGTPRNGMHVREGLRETVLRRGLFDPEAGPPDL